VASVTVQGETFRSSEEILDALSELEQARDNSPEYGPQRRNIEAHLDKLRGGLRSLKAREAELQSKASTRAQSDANRSERKEKRQADEKTKSRKVQSQKRRSQARDLARGSRRDVSDFAGATGISSTVGSAGDLALTVVGWTLLSVLFYVLIKPSGNGPKTVAAFSGGAQRFLDRLLTPSEPLIRYAKKSDASSGGSSSTAAVGPHPASLFTKAGEGMASPGLSRAIGRALGTHTIIGRPDVPNSTHDPTIAPNNWESDNAYDLAVKAGTPLYAITAGTLGSQIGSLGSSNPAMAGIRLHLVGATNEFYYAHLSKLAPGIKAGAKVKAGQLLGFSGSANGSAHLHIASKSGVF
jgi:murein DD-endopeptidase MepM/ murein hydrolase activator NlpD